MWWLLLFSKMAERKSKHWYLVNDVLFLVTFLSNKNITGIVFHSLCFINNEKWQKWNPRGVFYAKDNVPLLQLWYYQSKNLASFLISYPSAKVHFIFCILSGNNVFALEFHIQRTHSTRCKIISYDQSILSWLLYYLSFGVCDIWLRECG